MKLTAFLEGIGIGALAMFLLDPDRGNRRRSLIRDQAIHQVKKKREAVDIMTKDFANRSRGMKYRIQGRMKHEQVPNDVLCERVRSEVGRFVSHFHAINVECDQGVVTLAGPILASEVKQCLWAARMVPGVDHVVNNLEVHQSSDNLPELQGAGQVAQLRWTPATGLAMIVGGSLLTIYGLGKRGIRGGLYQMVGMAMVGKAFYDTEHRFDPSMRRSENKSEPSREPTTTAPGNAQPEEKQARSSRRKPRTNEAVVSTQSEGNQPPEEEQGAGLKQGPGMA